MSGADKSVLGHEGRCQCGFKLPGGGIWILTQKLSSIGLQKQTGRGILNQNIKMSLVWLCVWFFVYLLAFLFAFIFLALGGFFFQGWELQEKGWDNGAGKAEDRDALGWLWKPEKNMKCLESQAAVWIQKAIDVHHRPLSREAAHHGWFTSWIWNDLGLEVGATTQRDNRSDRITVIQTLGSSNYPPWRKPTMPQAWALTRKKYHCARGSHSWPEGTGLENGLGGGMWEEASSSEPTKQPLLRLGEDT